MHLKLNYKKTSNTIKIGESAEQTPYQRIYTIVNYSKMLNISCCYALLCLVAQLCPTHCNSMDCNTPGSFLCLWNSPSKNTGVGFHALLQRIPHKPGIEPRLPTLQEDSLPSEPPGKSPVVVRKMQINTTMIYHYRLICNVNTQTKLMNNRQK